MNKENMFDLEVAFVGKIKLITPDLTHKNGYEILLETMDEESEENVYMRMVLCVNYISYVEEGLTVGDEVYINGPLIFNSEEDGFGDPRLLILVRNFRK